MLEWKFWGLVLACVWAGSVGDVGCARDSSSVELSWEVMEGDSRGWPEAGGMPGWCRDGEPRLAAEQTPPRHSCRMGVMGEPGVAGAGLENGWVRPC